MSFIDWAKACGTCRTMHYAQFGCIAICAAPHSEAELCWIARRWHHFQCLQVDLKSLCRATARNACDDELCLPHLQSIIRKQTAPFRSLKNLSIDLGEVWRQASPEGWLAHILAQSPQLHFLQLHSLKPILLPSMCQLTHLLLNTFRMPSHCAEPLGSMPKLQVLLLKVKEYEDSIGLNLRECEDLRAVDLHFAMPNGLMCPEGCTICIESQPRFRGEAWEKLSKVSTAAHLINWHDTPRRRTNIARLLATKCCALTYLSIEVKSGGHIENLAQYPYIVIDTEFLPSLKHLRVNSTSCTRIRFSAMVRLKSVGIMCEVYTMLDVRFDDVKTFAESLEDACFCWEGNKSIQALLAN